MRYLAGGAAYIAIYALVVLALQGRPLAASMAGHLGLLAPPIALCLVVLRRRSRWEGCQRLFWDVVATGAALWVVGHFGWAYESLRDGQPSWLGWHTIFSLTGGVAPLLALLTRPYLGPRIGSVRHVSLVLAGWGLLALFGYAYFVIVPSLAPSESSADQALIAFALGSRVLLVLAAAGSLAAGWGSAWRRPLGFVAAGALVGGVLRIFASRAIVAGTYDAGSLYDLAWIVPFLVYLAAAADAPASVAEEARGWQGGRATALAAVPLVAPILLIPVVGYGWLLLQPVATSLDAFRALLTGLMTVAGIGLLSLRLASQRFELERADARLRLLAAATEQTADLILITRADGTIEHANEAFVRTLGYDRGALVGLRSADVMDPAFEGAARQIREEVRARGIWRGTLLRRRRDGTMFPAACTVVSLRDHDGEVTHYVGVERDTSDEVRLREQLVHTERLEAMGELVAGVAHEINNPLQTIIGSVELLMEERPDEGTRRDLEIVRREATRAAQIVRNLHAFVRRGGAGRAPADLNLLVRGALDLREFHLQQRDIALRVEYAPTPLDVLANREEIQQVLFNLLLNAEQAILSAAPGGTITVRTASAGNLHVVDVTDTGPGVPLSLRGRIFEPFFTTKPVGEGSGLGLSIAHGIAAAHGGMLEYRAITGGASFRLALPAFAAAESGAETETSVAGIRSVALVVDDEAPIRRLLVRLLERRGYVALEAPTGQAALDLAATNPPDLVLCDVRMPEMTGPELYRALNARAPKPRRFIFITGDRTALEAGDRAFSDVPVLSKPFSAAALDAVLAATSKPQ